MASLSPLTGTLGHRRAAHLLRRTSFNYSKPKVDQMAGQTAAQVLNSLLQLNALQQSQPIYRETAADPVETWLLPLPGTPQAGLPAEDFVLRRWNMVWWCNEALRDTGIGHKMQFFFHQFMQVTANTGRNSSFFDYLQLLRWGALGNFKKLAYKIVTDNSMLQYLNNGQNTSANPNENFAREFFELFTIGKGPQIGPGDYTNYTEDDIVQAAKVLTGFRTRFNRDVVDAETGIPRGDAQFVNQHVAGSKTFSSKFNNTVIAGATNSAGMWVELQAFVDMIFAQPETAKNLCRRLYRYFVSRNITSEIETDIIVPLSNTLVSNNFEVMAVLQQLLQSQHFFDADDSDNVDEIIGGLIKSPLELNYHTISFFGMPLPDPVTSTAVYFQIFDRGMLQRAFGTANLPLFFAADVAGYPAYYAEPDFNRQWFNSTTIISRYKMPEMFLSGKLTIGLQPNQPLGTKLDIAQWIKNSGAISNALDSQILVEDLLKYLLPEEVDTDRFNYFHILVFLDSLPPADWTYEWQNFLNTNDATEVTLALERLIKAILFSPEYQTF